jgi:H+/Cl- antiporter ClcA
MKYNLHRHARRYRGISWAPVLFLLVFLAALGVVSVIVLEAMLRTAAQASPEERRRISAYAGLLLCVMIAVLLGGLIATLRIGRATRMASTKHPPTQYTDAWAESARRMRTPPPEMLEEEDDGTSQDKT